MENNFDIHNWQAKFLKEGSSNTKTAVEWLIKELKDFGYYTYNLEKLCEQTKEMEKQQIIDAHIEGHKAPSSTLKNFDAEQYYNNKYK